MYQFNITLIMSSVNPCVHSYMSTTHNYITHIYTPIYTYTHTNTHTNTHKHTDIQTAKLVASYIARVYM